MNNRTIFNVSLGVLVFCAAWLQASALLKTLDEKEASFEEHPLLRQILEERGYPELLERIKTKCEELGKLTNSPTAYREGECFINQDNVWKKI